MPDETKKPEKPDTTPRNVPPERIESVSRNALGQLEVRVKGCAEPIKEARVARCFPWSLPETYVALRDKDGKEIALLKTLEPLDPASCETVERELQEKVFNPRILRVVRSVMEFGVISITAETDRGEVTFQVRSRDDIRTLSETRALFRDADGNTYELHDLNALDAASRKEMVQFF